MIRHNLKVRTNSTILVRRTRYKTKFGGSFGSSRYTIRPNLGHRYLREVNLISPEALKVSVYPLGRMLRRSSPSVAQQTMQVSTKWGGLGDNRVQENVIYWIIILLIGHTRQCIFLSMRLCEYLVRILAPSGRGASITQPHGVKYAFQST